MGVDVDGVVEVASGDSCCDAADVTFDTVSGVVRILGFDFCFRETGSSEIIRGLGAMRGPMSMLSA